MRMYLAGFGVGVTLILAGLAAPVAALDRTITVTGQGEVSVEPDMATIVIGIQAEAEETANAMDQASTATLAILARLDVEDIDPQDIRSGAIRLVPRYSQSVLSSGRQIIGYRAVNSIEVDVKDLARLGGLLSALVGDGANRLDRVSFGLQNPDEATDEARRRAIADGARLAALSADAAGVNLGDVLTIGSGGGAGYRTLQAEPAIMEEMAASSPQFDVPVAPGQIDLNASITMVFAISD